MITTTHKKRKFDQFPDPEDAPSTQTSINQNLSKTSYDLIFKTSQPSTLLKIYIKFIFNSTIRLEDLTPIEIDQMMKSSLSSLNQKSKELFSLIATCVTIIHNHPNTLDYIKLMDPTLLKLPCAIASEYGSDYLTLMLSLVDPTYLPDAVLSCISAAVGSCRDYLIPQILSFVNSTPISQTIINSHILIGACRSNRIQQIRNCIQNYSCTNDYDSAAMAAISSSNSDLYLAILYFGARNFSKHLALSNALNCPFKDQITNIAKIDEILASVYKTTSNAISIRLLNCAQMSTTTSVGNDFFSKEKSEKVISLAIQESAPYINFAIDKMARISFRPFAISVGLIDVNHNDDESKLSCDNERIL